MLNYAFHMVRTILCYLICITPLTAAESSGYRVVHPDGTVEFTDQPVEGAEPITLPEVPTYSAPPTTSGAGSATSAKSKAKTKKKAVEKSISITSPAPEQTVWFNEAGMSVSVQVSPALAEGEQVIVRLDGTEVARGSATAFTLQGVYRGTHLLSAAVVSAGGSVLRESPPITFYMRQHSAK